MSTFDYIQYIGWWKGQINAPHLMRHFQLTRDSVSAILKKYDNKYPHHFKYDQSLKARVITHEFLPSVKIKRFGKYFAFIKNSPCEVVSECIKEVEAPFRHVNAQPVRPILKAIREKLAIDIGYISLSNPDYLDRIIECNSLIFNGLCGDVSAYCRKNNAFRDFVLLPFDGNAGSDVTQNTLWNTFIDIVITPDPRLIAKQKAIIATDIATDF